MQPNSPIKLFSGTGSKYLAEKIADAYGTELGKVSVLRFSDGEIQPCYEETVFDNVELPLVIAGFGHHEITRRVRAALDKVSLAGKEKKYPLALSGGEQQRVGIARAVVNKPPIIIADEPTGNLDPELSEEIMFLFGQFQQVGVTVLIASHDISLITQLNHRVLKLDHGQLVSG